MGILKYFSAGYCRAVPFKILVPVKAGLGDSAVLARAACGGCLVGNNAAPAAPSAGVVLGNGEEEAGVGHRAFGEGLSSTSPSSRDDLVLDCGDPQVEEATSSKLPHQGTSLP